MSLAPHEDCRRCGGSNFGWAAPSPLWNLVMRENDINGPIKYSDLVCVGCFVELAAEAGVHGQWRLSPDREPEGLIYTTPSGRVWNPETWLWEEVPPPGDVGAAADPLLNIEWALHQMLDALENGRYRYDRVHVEADLHYLRGEIRRARRSSGA